jgi:glycosyltransferase involved in cell wall biosynthesis
MAAAVERVLSDQAQAGEMARRAREKALRTYHPQTVAQRHVEIYREVLAGQAKRG